MPAVIRTIIRIGLSGILLYGATVSLVVVPALNGWLPILFKQQTGRELHLRDLTLNPFTLCLGIVGVRNDNPDGTPFFAFGRAVVDVSLRSLWHGLTLDELRLDDAQIDVRQTAADRFNFSDILDHQRARSTQQPAPAADTKSADTPALTIDRLQLTLQHVNVDAPFLATPLRTRIKAMRLQTQALTTVVDGDANALPPLAIGRVDYRVGHVRIELPREPQVFRTQLDDIRFGIDNFSTREQPAQPWTLQLCSEGGGTIGANGQLSLAQANAGGQLQIQQLSLNPAWRYLAPWLHLDAEGGNLSARAGFAANWREVLHYRIDNASAELADLRIQAHEDADSNATLRQLRVDGVKLDSATRQLQIGTAGIDGLHLHSWNRGEQIGLLDMLRTEFPPSPPSNEAPWQVQLDQFALDNSRVDWRTDAIDQEELALTPLRVTAKQVHWPAEKPAEFTLATTINEATTVAVQGNLVPVTLTGAIDGEIKGLPLAWGNRYVEHEVTARISRGTLDAQWQMTLAQGQPQTLRADGNIDDFQLLRTPNLSQLAAWQRLRWQQLAIDLTRQHLTVARVDLLKPQARFRINADGTNNFQELVLRNAAQTTSTQPARSSPPAETAARPWQIDVALIHLDNGELDFRDNSLPRPFRARIGEFTGDIRDLGSAENAVARIDLTGSVDGYAPVTLTGTASPLRARPAIDLALDFTNLDLATFTTYSGTYAGYAINRGLLTLQLAYQLDDNRLKGRNRIVINQLELGERVQSPKAMDLPLRLAIALLTDENGVMDLGVDVSGNLDDPQFSVKGIIWKALRNVIVKVVTSPFRLLASLVGAGDQDLGQIDFSPGSDAITPEARARLTTLTQALAKRPALQLRVIGHSDPATDTGALQQQELYERLDEAGVSAADITGETRAWRNAIGDMYEQAFPDRDTDEQTPQQLASAVRDAIVLGPNALAGLAAKRALAVKRVLVVELGIATDRVLIDAARESKDAVHKAQAELRVDS